MTFGEFKRILTEKGVDDGHLLEIDDLRRDATDVMVTTEVNDAGPYIAHVRRPTAEDE